MQVLLIDSFTHSIHKHTINSACLPHKDDRPLYGTECFIAGYGYTVYDRSQSIPPKLQETSVPLIDYSTCAEWFHEENSRNRKHKFIITLSGVRLTQSYNMTHTV